MIILLFESYFSLFEHHVTNTDCRDVFEEVGDQTFVETRDTFVLVYFDNTVHDSIKLEVFEPFHPLYLQFGLDNSKRVADELSNT